MIVRDFVELLMHWTEVTETVLMVVRTTGPDNVSDSEKINHIYSVYKSNIESDRVDFFDKFLYNEFTFLEFDSEEEAYEFGLHNFPMNKEGDPDYFVQFFIFSHGNLAYANDSLSGLSDRIPQPAE